MNTAKIQALGLTILGIVVAMVTAFVPQIPQPWGGFITAVLGVLAYYKIGQSHTQAALGAAGYTRISRGTAANGDTVQL